MNAPAGDDVVLVTGATGFVGRALLPALLASGRPVIALLRRHAPDLPDGVIQRIVGDLEALDQEQWIDALNGADVVLHLAAIAHVGAGIAPERYETVNRSVTRAMGEAARAPASTIRRIVFMSSIRAQAGAASEGVLTEATPPRPTEPYGASKLAAERELREIGVETVVLRPVLVVGRQARGNLALLLRLADTPLPLPFAAFSARRSLVAVEDVAEAALRALDDADLAGKTCILAHPEALTLGEMIAALREGLGRPTRLFAAPEALLRSVLRLIGRADVWERMAGAQVARAEALTALGFAFRHPPRRALAAMARAAAGR